MNQLLLDTHIFLWLNDQPEKLSKAALDSCANPENSLYISLISLWEIQIKSQLGKLQLSVPWQTMLQKQSEENNLKILGLSEGHISQLEQLGDHHRDPFDRMLIAQAKSESMVMVSADKIFNRYDVVIIC